MNFCGASAFVFIICESSFQRMAESQEKIVLPEKISETEPQVAEILDQVKAVKIGEEGKAAQPCCIIILGMAGSGKTTFVQR